MQCLILRNEEISQEDCNCVIQESYSERNGKTLPKKIKRVAGWKFICKTCKYHTIPEEEKNKTTKSYFNEMNKKKK